MNPRQYRPRRRRSLGLLASAFLVAGILSPTAVASAEPVRPGPLPALADLPPQEPGVTLRVFDVQVPLSKLCDLKPGQTPNVDKLIPTVDWSSTDGFGFTNNFVSQTLANLDVPAEGSYEFRLISDDGSRLKIDDRLVIDHDGLHAAEPKDGSVTLSPGYHSLLVDHFDRGDKQQVTLQWKKPGDTEFTLVPNSVLSTDAGVVRVTSPGRKQCEGQFDTPGDGLPLNGVHPDYDLTDLRPDGFEPQVSGMDWLPDGRLAISTWGGSLNDQGEVYLLDHVTGKTSKDKVTYKKVAEGLKEPMGIKYVDGKLYVSEKHQLTELNDTDGDEVADAYRKIATWPFTGNFHQFAFGLLYDQGDFYLNLSVAINYGGASTNPQPAPNRGTTIKVNRETGKVTYLAGGHRTPNGIGWGPEGSILVADNQGGWLPANKIVQVKKNRFFGHYTNPPGPFDDQPVSKPVLWLPHNDIANSPTSPLYLKSGPYAGQLLFSDVTYGGIQRASLEKVNGDYQGAVFRHTQGLESGINRLVQGPDGALYVGGLGADGNWGQAGKLRFGLQKLSLNGKRSFDIHSMRANRDGFTLTYTQPLSDETVAKLATSYSVEQWRYVPTPAYGGPKIDEETLPVRSVRLSEDRRQVTLKLDGLRADRVVHVRSPKPFNSASGEELWSTEAWYTLNAIPGRHDRVTAYDAEAGKLAGSASIATNHKGYTGGGFVAGFGEQGASTSMRVEVDRPGVYDVGLRYSNGPHPFTGTKTVSVYVNGRKAKQTSLADTGTWDVWATQNEQLRLRRGTNTITYRVDEGDTGHVNLDMVNVHRMGERINLFQGGSLDNWQHTDGRSVTWPRKADGAIEVAGGDIRTKQSFRDFRLHVEFWLPLLPPDVTGQARANSGVYLQERYEVQVLDNFGKERLENNEAAAIYQKKAADVNAAKAPETWQSYDIVFTAARYDDTGAKISDARVSVWWNGVKVHDDVSVDGPTGGSIAELASTGAVRLQDHGNKVRYRNMWIQPLSHNG